MGEYEEGMTMDRFTKNALIGCTVICAIIIVFFYVGSALGHANISGTDEKVEGQAAKSGNKEAHRMLYELSENEEYIGFLFVGMIGGFIAGYAWTVVFDEDWSKRGEEHG